MKQEKLNSKHIDQEDETPIADFTKLTATFGSLILDKAFLVLLIGAIGYFLGWRFLYTYYGSFGLDASFFYLTPTDVVEAGWRSFLIMAVFLILAAVIYTSGKHICLQQIRIKGWHFALRLFIIVLIISILLLVVSIYMLFIWGTYLIIDFFILTIFTLAAFWITHIIGESLHETFKSNEKKWDLRSKFFTMVYPSPLLWLVTIIIGFIFLLAFLSSYNAALYATRDRGIDSTLQIATLYVKEELEIPDGQMLKNGVWMYDNLRFLLKADTTYFVFRLDEVTSNITTLYGISEEKLI
jgi:hypothetical protein